MVCRSFEGERLTADWTDDADLVVPVPWRKATVVGVFLDGAENSNGEQEDGFDEVEGAAYDEADEPEG